MVASPPAAVTLASHAAGVAPTRWMGLLGLWSSQGCDLDNEPVGLTA
jgi:hypothetical protein